MRPTHVKHDALAALIGLAMKLVVVYAVCGGYEAYVIHLSGYDQYPE